MNEHGTAPDPLRIGVIGLGAFGLRYVNAFASQPGVEVRWGCDLDVERHGAALDAGAVECTSDVDQVMNDSSTSAVVVVTPEATHRDLAVAASRAGKHVVVEKPLATLRADATAMIEAAEQADRLLLPAFLLRFDQRYAQVAARRAEIGPIRNIYAYRNFDRSLFDLYSRTHSFVENAIHDIDLIRWYVDDEVTDVHAFCRNTRGYQNPDVNWGVLEFREGAIAVIQTTWLYPPQESDRLQWNAGIQVMGDRGVLEVRNDSQGLTANVEHTGIALMDQTAWSEVYHEPRGAFGAMIRHFVACLRGLASPRGATARDALESTLIAERLIAACK